MTMPSQIACLTDIIEAAELIRGEMTGVTLQTFETDKRKRWLVERGVEIISEASRHLSDELKARHPEFHGQRWRGSAMCCAMSTSALHTMCCGVLCSTT